jgi:hypothetical protein
MRRFAAFAVGLVLGGAARAETCRFDGITSYDGRMTISEETAPIAGGARVDVKLSLAAHPLPLMNTLYEMEEISETGRDGLALLAVNNRYRVDGHIVRQSWDVFRRTASGLEAYRIEGKHAAEFARQFPRFARHWAFAGFGDDWLADFAGAGPVRRTDLDLTPVSDAVRPPLALAFHWLEGLGTAAVSVPVFLPGFKDRKLVSLAIGGAVAGAEGAVRVAPLVYPDLSRTRASSATAVLAGGRLVRIGFDVHGTSFDARATMRAVGCGSGG